MINDFGTRLVIDFSRRMKYIYYKYERVIIMPVKTIGVLSDTHDLLRPEVVELLQGCDVILHGGDVSSGKILDQLKEIGPLHAVRGNNYKGRAEKLPESLELELDGLQVYMTHKKKDLPKDLSKYDLVVYGHSHSYEEQKQGRTTLLNPGSCGPRRFHQPITLAILTLEDGDLKVERKDIAHPEEAPMTKDDIGKSDIEKIIRKYQKGHSDAKIAKDMHMSEALVEQILRLYLTHPGVDAEGIMKKLGL